MYAVAYVCNTTAMGSCCAVMQAQHRPCMACVYLDSMCVWWEVYTWVYMLRACMLYIYMLGVRNIKMD